MQMYMYFLGFPGDLNAVKGLVYSLFIVDTIQTVRPPTTPGPHVFIIAHSVLGRYLGFDNS